MDLQDIIAHLNNWLAHDITCIQALKEGKEPFWEPSVDGFNHKGVSVRSNKSWDEIYREFNELSDKLIKLYETLPKALWDKPIWRNKTETPSRFIAEDITHWGGHLSDLQKKFAAMGK